jgi:signal transduction histidine kinase
MSRGSAKHVALRDALAAGLVVLIGGCLFVELDSAERISSRLLQWEPIELDDLLLTSFLAVVATTWFALRRWRDAARELRARTASEQEKARYLERLEQLSSQLLQAEQHERERLSVLLHDEVGQTLFACRLQLERAQQRVSDDETRAIVGTAHELASSAMLYTRELSVDLSPPVLHDLGLVPALEWLIRRTHERFGLTARLVPGAGWERIPAAWHAPVFHSVRELLTNAAKHANANDVAVSAAIRGTQAVDVSVSDDGRGFDAPRGFGLFSIERRMAWLGAELRVESVVGQGTRATLALPNAD